MSILSTIRDLIKGSPDAETATTTFMEVLAREAIRSGDPDALAAVAAQWQELLEGQSARQLAVPATVASGVRTLTPPDALRGHVLEVMGAAWLSGISEVTTGVIQKGVDRRVRESGSWADVDLEEVKGPSGIHVRWKSALSICLQNMRQSGDIKNDSRAWKTYTLAPHMRPKLNAAPARIQLEPAWEVVSVDH
jgi:hypothetical protein